MNLQTQKFRNKNLSHYEIQGPLGRGSNSFVYKAKYIFTNSVVALKVIDIKTPESLERAKKEVHIHKTLSHEGIVGYIDDFKDNSYWYLVLEYCEKGELFSYLKRHNFSLAENEIRDIGLQLLKVLDYLEDCKVKHLDIKLGNILIKQSLTVKLGDFGFSEKNMNDNINGSDNIFYDFYSKEVLKNSEYKRNCGLRSKSQTPLCRDGKVDVIQGTPNYIAPELLEHGIKSHKADIWSLGCVLYALGAGATPFEGKTINQTFNNIINDKIYFPSHFSTSFIELLRYMLENKFKRRKSAKDLMKMSFFTSNFQDNTLSTIATDIDAGNFLTYSKKEKNNEKPSYLNQIDKRTIHEIVLKSNKTRNKSINTEPSDKTLLLAKSIKSKRLINETLAKQSNLASTLQAKNIIGKIENMGRISIQRNYS